ncbi:MAG: hypothetical protein ACU0CI_15130 [Shimia sp.]
MWRGRLKAALRDTARCLAVGAPVALWAATVRPDARLETLAWWALTAAVLAPVTLTLATRVRALTPPLAAQRLRLEGTGCLLCREMRRALPLALLPLAWLARDWGGVLGLALAGALILLHAADWGASLIRATPAHWDRATGFRITRAG